MLQNNQDKDNTNRHIPPVAAYSDIPPQTAPRRAAAARSARSAPPRSALSPKQGHGGLTSNCAWAKLRGCLWQSQTRQILPLPANGVLQSSFCAIWQIVATHVGFFFFFFLVLFGNTLGFTPHPPRISVYSAKDFEISKRALRPEWAKCKRRRRSGGRAPCSVRSSRSGPMPDSMLPEMAVAPQLPHAAAAAGHDAAPRLTP